MKYSKKENFEYDKELGLLFVKLEKHPEGTYCYEEEKFMNYSNSMEIYNTKNSDLVGHLNIDSRIFHLRRKDKKNKTIKALEERGYEFIVKEYNPIDWLGDFLEKVAFSEPNQKFFEMERASNKRIIEETEEWERKQKNQPNIIFTI